MGRGSRLMFTCLLAGRGWERCFLRLWVTLFVQRSRIFFSLELRRGIRGLAMRGFRCGEIMGGGFFMGFGEAKGVGLGGRTIRAGASSILRMGRGLSAHRR